MAETTAGHQGIECRDATAERLAGVGGLKSLTLLEPSLLADDLAHTRNLKTFFPERFTLTGGGGVKSLAVVVLETTPYLTRRKNPPFENNQIK